MQTDELRFLRDVESVQGIMIVVSFWLPPESLPNPTFGNYSNPSPHSFWYPVLGFQLPKKKPTTPNCVCDREHKQRGVGLPRVCRGDRQHAIRKGNKSKLLYQVIAISGVS
jgi:hypothetical protein